MYFLYTCERVVQQIKVTIKRTIHINYNLITSCFHQYQYISNDSPMSPSNTYALNLFLVRGFNSIQFNSKKLYLNMMTQ